MKRIMVLVLAFTLLTIGFSHMASNDSDGWQLSTLSDGSDEYEVAFLAGGKDTSTELSFRKGVEVLSASIDFTPLADTSGNYPTNVSIDFGDNVKPEWNFKGTGYGSWGEQTMFLDETHSQAFTIHGEGNATATVRLPKDCQVTSAVMEITGTPIDRNMGLQIGRTSGTGNNPWMYSSESNSNRPMLLINASSGNYTIQPTGVPGKDSYTSSQQPNNNYGNSIYVMGGWADEYTFAQYDVSAIPNDAVIYKAIYSTYHAFTNVAGKTYEIYRVLDDWTELGVTYNSRPTVDPVSHASLVFPGGTNAWRSWNITTLVEAWIGLDQPSNVTIDIGADSANEFLHHGNFSTTNLTSDLSTYFNTYIAATPPTHIDSYGNTFVDVPVNVSTDTRGRISLLNLSIVYDMTVSIDGTSTISLVDELNDLIPPEGAGNHSVTIAVTSTSAGIVKISEIDIEFNGYPIQNKTISSCVASST